MPNGAPVDTYSKPSLPNARREPLEPVDHSPVKISWTFVNAAPSSLPRCTVMADWRRPGGFESGITSPSLL